MRLLSKRGIDRQEMPIIGRRFRAFKPLCNGASVLDFTALRLGPCSFERADYNTSTVGYTDLARRRTRRGWRATGFMARPKTSLFRRILVQTDCAFWCIHDHLDVLAYLGLPTLAALLTSALVLVGIWRTWDFPAVVDVLIAGVLFPFLALLHLHRAAAALRRLRLEGRRWRERPRPASASPGAGAAPAGCLGVLFRLGLLWLGSLLLLGIPLLWVWPRTCLDAARRPLRGRAADLPPQPANPPRGHRRPLMGFLYLGMGIVLGGLVVLPRLLLGTPMLGAHLLDAALAADDRRSPLDLRDDVRRDPPDRHRDELVDLAHPGLPRHPMGPRGRRPQAPDRRCFAPGSRPDGAPRATPGPGKERCA